MGAEVWRSPWSRPSRRPPRRGRPRSPGRRGSRPRPTVVAVEIPVRVLRDGQPVRGLTAENFAVFDEGEPREITSFDVLDLEDRPRAAGARTGRRSGGGTAPLPPPLRPRLHRRPLPQARPRGGPGAGRPRASSRPTSWPSPSSATAPGSPPCSASPRIARQVVAALDSSAASSGRTSAAPRPGRRGEGGGHARHDGGRLVGGARGRESPRPRGKGAWRSRPSSGRAEPAASSVARKRCSRRWPRSTPRTCSRRTPPAPRRSSRRCATWRTSTAGSTARSTWSCSPRASTRTST